MIDIKGLDKAKVLQALYNNSKQQGLGFLEERGYYDLSYEEAKKLLEITTDFDYLYGRIMKVNLSGDSFSEYCYDRDNGKGAALRVINHLIVQKREEERRKEICRSAMEISSIVNQEVTEENKIEVQLQKNYDRVIFTNIDNGIYIVVKNNKYGVVSLITGEVIIPCSFDKYVDALNEWMILGCPTTLSVNDENKSLSRK